MATVNFSGCAYGPFELRRLLRRRLQPGEGIVAWHVASTWPRTAEVGLMVGAVVVPWVGFLVVEQMHRRARRVVVLTDRRLLLLRADGAGRAPRGLGVVFDAPLHALAVRTAGARSVWIAARANAGAVRLGFPAPRGPAQERLLAGLEILAGARDEQR